eukprot:CAMPEP_0175297694 /NCGR_PEP_ID=MMETSP0093-20121207/59701_1 /TAXON_ID=311494 /ORGANISM="Alexandrium monilatum, Strain CCMP3105" /LENGTH=170 /DNA_ID=CAMNT_0016593779 /DNA_START=418 /DNA_END=931 /DNA_ORIENTATION=+
MKREAHPTSTPPRANAAQASGREWNCVERARWLHGRGLLALQALGPNSDSPQWAGVSSGRAPQGGTQRVLGKRVLCLQQFGMVLEHQGPLLILRSVPAPFHALNHICNAGEQSSARCNADVGLARGGIGSPGFETPPILQERHSAAKVSGMGAARGIGKRTRQLPRDDTR